MTSTLAPGFTEPSSGTATTPPPSKVPAALGVPPGWVTIQDPLALGPNPNVLQELQLTDIVETGAALMLKPLTPGTSFTFVHNLNLQGVGLVHPYSLISNKGAVVNLGGLNTLSVEHYYYDEKYVKNLKLQIEKNNQRIASFKKQLTDLEEDLRVKGLPARWADPPAK